MAHVIASSQAKQAAPPHPPATPALNVTVTAGAQKNARFPAALPTDTMPAAAGIRALAPALLIADAGDRRFLEYWFLHT